MIKVKFYHAPQTNALTGFVLTGHAGYAAAGADIVCAGVSALAINAVNSLQQLAEVEPAIESNDRDGGYLSVKLPATQIENSRAQLLLASLRLGLQAIGQQYPKYVSLIQ